MKNNADDRLRDLPQWSQPFTENLEDTETLAPAQVSQDSDSERTTKVAEKLMMHTTFTHFPKSRDCDVCLRTKITTAPCRRRTGEVSIPRGEKFRDLIKADYKVLNEECESRNNHRYAVVVQDLATQWIQSHPCKNKTSQETEEFTKVSRAIRKAKGHLHKKILGIFQNPVKIIGRQHLIDLRRMAFLNEEYKE